MESISVVMPVYNTPVPILKEAVDSILNQTFQDFEFIIIDDGSEGETAEYLDSLTDYRVKLIRNKTNIGITKSLNIGFRAAQGKYIARMDADDISCKERLEKQYTYMERHPNTVLCGCAVEEFGSISRRYYTKPCDPEVYRIKALFYYPGPLHPTMFLRRETLNEYNISYNEDLFYAQDYGLLVDISRCGGVIYILPDFLLKRRHHERRISSQYIETQKKCSLKIQEKQLCELLTTVSIEDVSLHYRYFYEKSIHDLSDACNCLKWAIKLIRANHRTGLYCKTKFAVFTLELFGLVIGQSFLPSFTALIVSSRSKNLLRRNRRID